MILFADDDLAMRIMVAEALSSAGHAVRLAADGEAALSAVRSSPPDLVVLDYRMGSPDGLEVCRAIKSDPQLEHLPVLILTGEGALEHRMRGFEVGANDYLPKPFDPRELVARVQALLRLTEQSRSLNPTTGLPGGAPIEREYESRRRSGEPFTLAYLDLENFKAFNDRFGFATANGVIEGLGAGLRRIIAGTRDFAGHIGGDDFVLMCGRERGHRLVHSAREQLRDVLTRLLPPEVVRRGHYLGRLRDGSEQVVPLPRLTAVLAHLRPGEAPDLAVLAERAAEGKNSAKAREESGILEIEGR